MSTVGLTEAAGIMKVCENTVVSLIQNGSIPAAKIGRAWVMLERDVLAYVEQQIAQQTAARFGMTLKAPARRRERMERRLIPLALAG